MHRTRAYRRHQYWRAMARAKRFLKDVLDYPGSTFKLAESDRHVHMYANNRKPCSCYICSGNKREEHKWERRIAKQELCKDIQDDIMCPKKKYSW